MPDESRVEIGEEYSLDFHVVIDDKGFWIPIDGIASILDISVDEARKTFRRNI